MTTSSSLLLDLDGTLADSLDVARQVYDDLLRAFGRVGAPDEFEALNGVPLRVIAERLVSAHALDVTPDALASEHAARYASAYAAVRPARGARELVSLAGERGWRVAVVTSAARTLALDWLARWGLTVDALIAAESVRRGKPDPEPYLCALRELGASPEQATAVEDSRLGAQAAVGAGVATVVVGAPDRAGWPAGVRFCADLQEVASTLLRDAERAR